MTEGRTYSRPYHAAPNRPSIGHVRRLSGLGLVAALFLIVTLIGWGVFELAALIVARVIDHPTAGRLMPSAVESVVRVTHLM